MRQTDEIFRTLVLFTEHSPSSGERRLFGVSPRSGTTTVFMSEQLDVRQRKFHVLPNSSLVFMLFES